MSKVKRSSWHTFTQAQVDRYRRLGFMIQGVVYHDELVNIHGAAFYLIDEGQPMAQFVRARKALHESRDVVGTIYLCRIVDDD